MEFDHELVSSDEQNFPDWSQFGEFLSDPHPLPGCENTTSDLLPLPESLYQFHDTSSYFCSPDPILDHESTTLVPECNQHSDTSQSNQLVLDDIDLNYFAWNTSKDGKLAPCSDNNEQYFTSNDGSDLTALSAQVQFDSTTAEQNVPAAAVINWENKGRTRVNEIGLDEMRNYFHMPIAKAAKEMNVGLTVFKKRCRELGISRWPHRKMKSLRSLIHNVQELGQTSSEETIRRELPMLEEYRRMMEDNPEMQLTEKTKKLRQTCFKANYKRRRLFQEPRNMQCL